MTSTITPLLLVDDEEGIRTVLSLLLTDMGFKVSVAASGDEALALFQESHFPIVITDMRMPQMTGLSLLHHIKDRDPHTEVIMLTGHGDMDLAVESLRAGAGDFLSKPISDKALEVALKRASQRITLHKTIQRHTEELEELVAQRTKELIQTERLAAIGETAASLAHSIKNIAGALEGTMYVLEKGLEMNKREYVEEGWQMIRHDLVRVRDLAMNLLHLGRKSVLHLQSADPEQPLREVAKLLASRAKQAGINLVLECSAGSAPFVMDTEMTHRCLLNLALNAIEACETKQSTPFPQGNTQSSAENIISTTKNLQLTEDALQVRLACTRYHVPLEKDRIIYKIIDNAQCPPDALRAETAKLFATTKEGGSGIGLFATRKSAHEMGAELDFANLNSGGTEVTLILTEP